MKHKNKTRLVLKMAAVFKDYSGGCNGPACIIEQVFEQGNVFFLGAFDNDFIMNRYGRRGVDGFYF
jgi:hypothetical protein